jgi:hypothetical protein
MDSVEPKARKRPVPTKYFTELDGGIPKQFVLPMTIRQRRRIMGDFADSQSFNQHCCDLEEWGRENQIEFQFGLLYDVRERYSAEYDRVMTANDIPDHDRERILKGLQDREEYLFNAFFFDNRTHAFMFKLRWFG